MKGSKRKRSPAGLMGGWEWLASGLAIGALGLLSGFIAVPILSLVVWTLNEVAWGALASPVSR